MTALCWSSREEIPHVQGKGNLSKMKWLEGCQIMADIGLLKLNLNFIILWKIIIKQILNYFNVFISQLFHLHIQPCCSYCLVSKLCLTRLRPHGVLPARLLCPWNFPGKNTRVGCHFLLQGIFLTQGSNAHFLHCQEDSLPLSHQESPHSIPISTYNTVKIISGQFLYFK